MAGFNNSFFVRDIGKDFSRPRRFGCSAYINVFHAPGFGEGNIILTKITDVFSVIG
jgi:hypothetical protein